jgi:hypothetical protein
VVASVRGTAVLLLVDWEVHVGNLLVAGEVGNVPWYLAGTGGAIVWSVKTAGVAIPPVVVSFDRMGRVVALSACSRVVACPASVGSVAVVAGAVTIVL